MNLPVKSAAQLSAELLAENERTSAEVAEKVASDLALARAEVGQVGQMLLDLAEQNREVGVKSALIQASRLVESLGLTEERCCDDTRRAQEETGKYNVYTCDDSYMSCRTRLVSKWSER